MFNAGDKVKCVADKYHTHSDDPREYLSIIRPIQNEVYTIREFIFTEYGFGVRLDEIRNKKIMHKGVGLREPIFGSNRFTLATVEDLKPKKKQAKQK